MASYIQSQVSNTTESKRITKKAYSAYQSVGSSQDTAWDVVEKYLPLVKATAAKMSIYFPDYIDREDIYSIGITALISAVQNYDSSREKSFGKYAKIRVRGALLDELRRIDWLSRDDRNSAKKYKKSVLELEQRLGRQAQPAEVCEELGLTNVQYRKMEDIKTTLNIIPLDAPFGENRNDGYQLHEIVSDPTEQNGRDLAENNEIVELLQDCLEELENTHKKILVMYYVEGFRLAEIAEACGKTESRICQIHAEALAKVRKKLKDRMLT